MWMLFEVNIMKKICVILFLVIIFLIPTGCKLPPAISARNPLYREYTKWTSTDGKIRFSIGVSSSSFTESTGVIYAEDEEIHIRLIPVVYSFTIYVYSADEEWNPAYEEWNLTNISENEFVVKVVKTTFFTKGDKITFCLMESRGVDNQYSVLNQEYTYWKSDNGEVWFYVTEKGKAAGEIIINDVVYPVYIRGQGQPNIYIYSIDAFSYLDPFFGDLYEEWKMSSQDDDCYCVKINNSIFNRSGEIIIRKVDELSNKFEMDYISLINSKKDVNSNSYDLDMLMRFFGEYPGSEYSVYGLPNILDPWDEISNNNFRCASVMFGIDMVRQIEDTYYTIFSVKQGGFFCVFWKTNKYNEIPIPFQYVYITDYKNIEDFNSLQIGVSTAKNVMEISSATEICFKQKGYAFSYTILDDNTILKISYERKTYYKSREDLIIKSIEQIDIQEGYAQSYIAKLATIEKR